MRFTAEVGAAGRGGHAVVVPAGVTTALGSKKAAVLAVVGGVEHRTRLASHAGRTYLGLPAALLNRLGVRDGDVVEVELSLAEEPATAPEPDVPEPAELTALLTADAAARTAWSGLSPEQQQEYHRWLAGAEDPAVRGTRLDRLAHRLRTVR
ncbi:DUF1905 domain-containing protein [Microlunatus capsulatus]|uniref:Antitoxin component of MazEF toxin-antitoxin module n=1 Tax=Microlunatus capsulatus TaxID=99117 RepID=A0ABS4Z9R7_9ACTN|nr:DUF1905 domain-containing protein [Microlunatus capsulatus]MBP2417798.1 antitoxin component of MazEF toxin-antitoxin module [Microlunatus capsulatus]